MADNPTCLTCRWWETESSSCPGVFGECRRNAPIRREDREGVRAYPYPAWPPTSAQDWCGEHAPVKAEEAPIPCGDVMQARFDLGPCPDHQGARLELCMYGKPACGLCLSSVIDHEKARAWAAPKESTDAR